MVELASALEWSGCVTGVAGSLLLALKRKESGFGFILFLISNGFWLGYGWLTHAPGLITQQLFFTATSTTGIYFWIVKRSDSATQSAQGSLDR